jgi:hypothetical protein
VAGGDLGLAGSDPEQRLAIDDEARHVADATRSPRRSHIPGRTEARTDPSCRP